MDFSRINMNISQKRDSINYNLATGTQKIDHSIPIKELDVRDSDCQTDEETCGYHNIQAAIAIMNQEIQDLKRKQNEMKLSQRTKILNRIYGKRL